LETSQALIVESTQSMANHLEATAWDRSEQQPVDTFQGLPYVRVIAADDDRYLTSSRTEAHRLASAFVKHSTLDGTDMTQVIKERLKLRDDTPFTHRDIAQAVFALDPFCLIHGVFFADKPTVWPGQPKIRRALTAFIEAVGVQRAESGGVKRDDVRHQQAEGGGSAEGYGFVPFHRTEWVAAEITASFVLDRAQLASYGLPESATELLESVAMWEIRSLLDHGLRLRTFCDLEPCGSVDDALPTIDELDSGIRKLIAASSELFAEGSNPLVVRWSPKAKSR
jgi:CRISPR-associated protein Csb1